MLQIDLRVICAIELVISRFHYNNIHSSISPTSCKRRDDPEGESDAFVRLVRQRPPPPAHSLMELVRDTTQHYTAIHYRKRATFLLPWSW